jgi:hypothetical protein
MARCEVCVEREATLQLDEINVCDDCFAKAISTFLRELLGRRCCGQPIRRKGLLMICPEPYGSEHDHDAD